MLIKRNESYILRFCGLDLETSGDLPVKVNVSDNLEIKDFTFINDFNWYEAEKRLQEVLEKENERVFYISNIYRVRNDLDLNNRNNYDEEETFISEYVDNNLLEKIECMNLEEIIDYYWQISLGFERPEIKSIDSSYIVLESVNWDNDLVLYIDARMGYSDLETQYYLVHEIIN